MEFATIQRGFATTRSKRTLRYYSVGNAKDCIGPLSHGSEVFVLTQGQFSLFDVMEYLLEVAGPADVNIATWTAAGADTKQAKIFLKNGKIKSIRWVVDRSFMARQPSYCQILLDEFGDCIRTTRAHAKFITVINDDWAFAVRTSMNLNSNPRIEDVEISEDRDLANYLVKFVDECFEKLPPADNFKSDGVTKLKPFDEHDNKPMVSLDGFADINDLLGQR